MGREKSPFLFLHFVLFCKRELCLFFFVYTKVRIANFQRIRVAVWSGKTTAAKGFALGIVSARLQWPVKDLERYALFGPMKISPGLALQSSLRGGTSKEG